MGKKHKRRGGAPAGRYGSSREPRLGIDIGRVIIAGGTVHAGDTSFFGSNEEEAMGTPMVPGAFDTIAELVEAFDGRAWLVSKCGQRIRQRSLRWLDHHGFWQKTGVSPQRVRFCKERKQKAGHAVDLGLTHFVDDRADVLRHLVGIVDHLCLFGPQKPRSTTPPWATATLTWDEVARVLLPVG